MQTNQVFGQVDLDDWLIERIEATPTMSVLDVGCGTGHHLLSVAQRLGTGRYCGLDISANSVEEARRRARTAGIGAEFVVGDAADATLYPDGSFDRIISIYALYYANKVPEILATLKGKLRPGGRLAVMSPYHRNNEEWYGFLSQFMTIPAEIEQVADAFMDTVVLPFAHTHFTNVDTCEFANPVTIPSSEGLQRYWISNVYHQREHDAAFDEAARSWFSTHDHFQLTKRALLAVMG